MNDKVKEGVVENKEYLKDYESGSGGLYIPILGDIFSSLFGQEMKAEDKWFVFVRIDKLYRYEVDKIVYDQISIGDRVVITIGKYGMPNLKPLE